MDEVKYVRLEQQDGSYSNPIPIVADGNYVDIDGDNVIEKLNKKPYYYNTVASMKADIKLKNGDVAITLGYYTVNDGGGAEYKIVNSINNNEYQESLTNGIYATLIHKPNFINMKTVGCKSDVGSFDNSTIINNIIEKFGRWFTYYFPFGIYYIKNPIVITKNCITILGDNERSRFVKTSANGVNKTIETSNGVIYDLNNYDICFYIGKETSDAATVSKVKIKNFSIQGYDSTETSHCILLIGCGYFKTENIQLVDYNKGILLDNCFACNLDSVTALTFGNNRTAIEIKDSTAIYISNSYLSARYYSVLANNSRIYIDNIACEAHGYVFNILNESFCSIVNSRCETYASDIHCSNSEIVASNCDFEGHGNNFTQFMSAANNSKINIKNSTFRYQVYEGSEIPQSITGFTLVGNSLVNCELYMDIYNDIPVNNSITSSSLYLVDLNSDGIKFDVTPAEGITFSEYECYVKDGYVNIYLAGNKSTAFEQNTSTEIGTISNIPLPTAHAHRFNLGTGLNNVYTTYNNAYGGINTTGKMSIQTPQENQRYFVIDTRYKIR